MDKTGRSRRPRNAASESRACGLGSAWPYPTSAAPAVLTAPTTAPETTAPRQKRSRAERLLAEYACWTGEIPAGQSVPTHAVVTLPGQRAELVDADTGFAIWLDGAPGVLHGFCP